MRKTAILAVCSVVPAFLGCGKQTTVTQSRPPNETLPVIVHVETRDVVITAMAGPEGPVYTVRTADGRTLGQQLSGRELQVRLPHIHRLLKTSYAEDAQHSTVWAGMDAHNP